MCTLTYIPGKNNYIITSNRDEHTSRAHTNFPVEKLIGGKKVIFPQDPKAGGTWLASSEDKKSAVLLNGAFEAHPYRPPYGLSRGIVLLDSFSFKDLKDFMRKYAFDGIEPFTLVHIFAKDDREIEELRWDGKQLHHHYFDHKKAHIWSSTMLYSKEIRQEREKWFNELLKNDPDAEAMSHFHHFGGYADIENNLKMDRGNGLRTLSISQLVLSEKKTSFLYQNLISGKDEKVII